MWNRTLNYTSYFRNLLSVNAKLTSLSCVRASQQTVMGQDIGQRAFPAPVTIAQAVFLLDRGQTDRQTNRQTRLNALPMPAAIQKAWVLLSPRDPRDAVSVEMSFYCCTNNANKLSVSLTSTFSDCHFYSAACIVLYTLQ